MPPTTEKQALCPSRPQRMTTTTTSPPTSRQVLGPLTATFVPPEECTIFGVQITLDGNHSHISGFSLAQGCSESTEVDTTTCWPSIATSLSILDSTFAGLGFYSPGLICPSGWTSACTAAQLSNGSPSPLKSGTSFNFMFALEPEETAVGCCPS